MNAIEITDLRFSYGENPILTDVSLALPEGEFLAVIGPNGGGKSTLLKIILGILRQDAGSVRIFGKTVNEAARLTGYVPQDVSSNRGFPITAFQVAMMGRMRLKGRFARAEKADYAKVRSVMEYLEVEHLADSPVDNLSGGQRQRVYIARALAMEPRMLFLDEPTSSVDTKGQKDLFDRLRELNKTMTIVVVSHDLSIIPRYATSVACINNKLHFHSSPEVTPEMLRMAYGSTGCDECDSLGIPQGVHGGHIHA
ncbi:MAG: ABC transporter ATP-binding protein [Geovibrio sp.]|nr:ABC transporter ATP-binding protein [Geovibrio sp.]